MGRLCSFYSLDCLCLIVMSFVWGRGSPRGRQLKLSKNIDCTQHSCSGHAGKSVLKKLHAQYGISCQQILCECSVPDVH